MIDKGITKRTLKNIVALEGQEFSPKDVVAKGADYASSRAALTRFVEKGLVKKIGHAKYQATIKDENIVATYYGEGNPLPIKPTPAIRKVPYRDGSELHFHEDGDVYLALKVTLVPAAGPLRDVLTGLLGTAMRSI